MSAAPGRHRAGALPGAVKVRLSGEQPGLDALTAVLASAPAVEIVTGPDGPYPNRREPGARVYLTVRMGAPGTAHGHQAVRRPAALRRH